MTRPSPSTVTTAEAGRSPDGSGSRPEDGANSTVVSPADAASIPNAVYVIIGSSGEYSDRYERVIGFVLTENDAQKAVTRAEHERALPDPIPYPKHEGAYGYQLENGSWFDGYILDRPTGAVWRKKPDASEITARQEAGRAAWRQARVDAGRIDPDGSMDSYYYETALAIAMEARSGETEGLDPKDDSAGPKDIAHD